MKKLAQSKAVSKRRWFRFAYFTRGRKGCDVLPHQLRDAEAALFMHSILQERGYAYAGPIFNYPVAKPARPIPVDDSFLRADDLLVLTTRPPLDDADEGVKCYVDRSYTTLEDKVFAFCRRHLARCSRSNVIVSDIHARAYPQVAQFRNIQYRQNRGASIDRYLPYASNKWQRPTLRQGHTAAYLIYEAHAWANGPGVLAAFGMSGTDTLVWNYQLATVFGRLLASAPFAMAELIAPQEIPRGKLTIDFANEWQVRLLTVPE